jgi:hypothetical protein
MGFKPPKKLYKLSFDDPEYAGLEIYARSLSIEKFLAVSRLSDELKNKDDKEAESIVNDLFTSFVKSVDHWNIEDDNDKPVPLSLKGLKSLDYDFVVSVIRAWLAAMANVDPSLGKDLNSGNRALEQSLPMAQR